MDWFRRLKEQEYLLLVAHAVARIVDSCNEMAHIPADIVILISKSLVLPVPVQVVQRSTTVIIDRSRQLSKLNPSRAGYVIRL